MSRSVALTTLLCLLAAPGCDKEPEECGARVAEFMMSIATECDVATRCGQQADPNAVPPRVRYSSQWDFKLRQIVHRGCNWPDLGEMPFFCNNGFPGCPPNGYECGDTPFASNVCLKKK